MRKEHDGERDELFDINGLVPVVLSSASGASWSAVDDVRRAPSSYPPERSLTRPRRLAIEYPDDGDDNITAPSTSYVSFASYAGLVEYVSFPAIPSQSFDITIVFQASGNIDDYNDTTSIQNTIALVAGVSPMMSKSR